MNALSTRPHAWAYARIPDARPAAIHWPGPDRRPPGLTVLPLSDDVAMQPVGTIDDPAAESFAHLLMSALLDAIQGRRSPTQLIRWVSDDILAELVTRARLHQRAPVPLSLRSVRLQQVGDDALEVAARFRSGERYAAAALRLERVGNRWLCLVADFGPLAPPVEMPLPRLLDQRRV
ncbi:Rv3235 family protein [Ammonicoccus fulvus]|uniref:Rv3235 family protein n=1 Tax=Ammonicoccus fulvus TaxID=3138240 RepID=A0ABZ3FR68_9ACTN